MTEKTQEREIECIIICDCHKTGDCPYNFYQRECDDEANSKHYEYEEEGEADDPARG